MRPSTRLDANALASSRSRAWSSSRGPANTITPRARATSSIARCRDDEKGFATFSNRRPIVLVLPSVRRRLLAVRFGSKSSRRAAAWTRSMRSSDTPVRRSRPARLFSGSLQPKPRLRAWSGVASNPSRVPWLGPFSTLVIIVVVVVIISGLFLHKARFGRYTYAIGSNSFAALAAGINVRRHLTKIYALSGLLAGLAGMFPYCGSAPAHRPRELAVSSPPSRLWSSVVRAFQGASVG